MKRRHFLKTSTAAAAAAAIAPTILIPRVSRAVTPAFGTVDHVLVLFAQGGLRSHCIFNAVGSFQHNPFGTQTAAPGTQWVLGSVCRRNDIQTQTFGTIPGFHQITSDIAVVACVDHTPGAPPDVNHPTAVNRIASGDTTGQNGLLSLIGKDHPNLAGGFSETAIPPIDVGGSNFGKGTGIYATTRPLTVQVGAGAGGPAVVLGEGWNQGARAPQNERLREHRSRAYRARLSSFMTNKTNAALFSSILQNPLVDVIGAPGASDAGFTNAELLEVLGDYLTTTIGDNQAQRSWGRDVATALRYFSFGAPCAVVTRNMYDLHDQEGTRLPPRSEDLVRQLAGLNYLLKAMPHPGGGTYWDHTLVTVVSEFSRNNTLASTGFNSGGGSDHQTENPEPSQNQALPVMGGAIDAAGKGGALIGSTDSEMNPTGPVFSSRSFLSTILDVQGIPSSAYWADPAISELFS